MAKNLFTAKSIHRTLKDGPLQGANRMKLPFRPTPEQPMIVSASELGSFLRCRLQWNWSYRVGIASRKYVQPRTVGIYVHAGKEGWYKLPKKKRTPEAMQKHAQRIIRKLRIPGAPEKDKELALAMLVGYAEWVNDNHDKSDHAIGKDTVWPEWEFVLPLVEDESVLIRGRIDELFEPTIYRGVLAMDETKTRGDINFDMLDMNHQMTIYLWAMSKRYPKYKRYIAWRTVMRRQMPGPRVRAPLFGREPIERNDEELVMWEKETRRTVTDMLDAAIYPSPRDSCRWECDFYNLCLVRANKRDLKEIINSEYVIK